MLTINGNLKEMLKEIIMDNSDFILVINEGYNIATYLVVDNRLQFVTARRPKTYSAIVNDNKEKIFNTLNYGKCSYHIFEDGYSFKNLLKFAKLYDKENKGTNANTLGFYKKYKKLFEQNIVKKEG